MEDKFYSGLHAELEILIHFNKIIKDIQNQWVNTPKRFNHEVKNRTTNHKKIEYNSGIALVTTLIILTIVSLLTVIGAKKSITQAKITSNQILSNNAFNISKNELEASVFEYINIPTSNIRLAETFNNITIENNEILYNQNNMPVHIPTVEPLHGNYEQMRVQPENVTGQIQYIGHGSYINNTLTDGCSADICKKHRYQIQKLAKTLSNSQNSSIESYQTLSFTFSPIGG